MSHTTPTVVLVHGAFAESASWNGVIKHLHDRDITSTAVANPLRSLTGDAAYVRDVIGEHRRPGPARRALLRRHGHHPGRRGQPGRRRARLRGCVRPGHRRERVRPLRQLPRQHPRRGPHRLSPGHRRQRARDPPRCLHRPVRRRRAGPRRRPDGGDAAARDRGRARRGPADGDPGVEDIPSWFVFGDQDRNIPAAALRFRAERAGARHPTEIAGASHAISVSRPEAVAAPRSPRGHGRRRLPARLLS